MKNSFWGLIWSSFLEIQGVLIGFLGVTITILLSRFPFKTAIPLDLVIIVAFFSLLLIATLVKASAKTWQQYKYLEQEYEKANDRVQQLESKLRRLIVPKVIVAQKIQTQTALQVQFLLESSELFNKDMYVSFCHTNDDGFEIIIGTGYIEAIQSDGKLLAIIDNPNTIFQDILEKLFNNDQKVLKTTVVKPGISRNKLNLNQP